MQNYWVNTLPVYSLFKLIIPIPYFFVTKMFFISSEDNSLKSLDFFGYISSKHSQFTKQYHCIKEKLFPIDCVQYKNKLLFSNRYSIMFKTQQKKQSGLLLELIIIKIHFQKSIYKDAQTYLSDLGKRYVFLLMKYRLILLAWWSMRLKLVSCERSKWSDTSTYWNIGAACTQTKIFSRMFIRK